MKITTRVAALIGGASVLTAMLGGCDAQVERWRIDAGAAACKEHGGTHALVTWLNEVVCVDGKIVVLKRGE